MISEEQKFDLFGDDDFLSPETASKQSVADEEPLTVEALQVVRIERNYNGQRSRVILDTIVVNYPSMTYERALKKALHKAKMLGNCMVVEKLERVVGSF